MQDIRYTIMYNVKLIEFYNTAGSHNVMGGQVYM